MKWKTCIVMLGAPCSGKSTIGKQLSDYMNVPYISSGDIARKIAESDAATKETLNSGGMCPEDAMRAAISEELKKDCDIILDGFPRFEEQKYWLEHNAYDYNIIYIYVNVSMIQAYERSYIRNRSDDGAFHIRYKYYAENTKPMIDKMLSENTVCVVDNNHDTKNAGEKAVRDIIGRIITYIEKQIGSD